MGDSDTPYSARGLLMLRPIPTFFMEDLDTTDMLDLDTSDTMAMDSDTESMARGLLMLRLSLILTTSPTVMDTPDTSDMDTLDMPDSDTADTTSASRLYQDLSVNHRLNLGKKWIVISLKFP